MKRTVAILAMLCIVLTVSASSYSREDLVGSWKLSAEDNKALDAVKDGYMDLGYRFKADGTGQFETNVLVPNKAETMLIKMKYTVMFKWLLDESTLVLENVDMIPEVVDVEMISSNQEERAKMEAEKSDKIKTLDASLKAKMAGEKSEKETRLKIAELKGNRLVFKNKGKTMVFERE